MISFGIAERQKIQRLQGCKFFKLDNLKQRKITPGQITNQVLYLLS